ncbi:MAG TPA: hypothetical protein EYP78_03380 [Candidatus Omnitrophica bacterium]|nr:hypothetical protein [Candidatus Omnitrophota bacterium]
MESKKWKVKKKDGKIYGPADTETFRKWIQERRILAEDYVSIAEKEEWVQVRTVSEFQDLFAGVDVAKPTSGEAPQVRPSSQTQCSHCGGTLEAGATFCVKCGTDLKTGKKVGEMTVEKAERGVDMATVGSATFFQRLLAYILDSIIVDIIFGILMIPVFMKIIMIAKKAAEVGPEAAEQMSIGPMGNILFGIGVLLVFSYYIFFWTKFGATPGKMVLKLKVVREDGSYLSIGGAIVRLIGYWVSSLGFNLGYLWMIWDAENQCWHDKMARSYVVVLR